MAILAPVVHVVLVPDELRSPTGPRQCTHRSDLMRHKNGDASIFVDVVGGFNMSEVPEHLKDLIIHHLESLKEHGIVCIAWMGYKF